MHSYLSMNQMQNISFQPLFQYVMIGHYYPRYEIIIVQLSSKIFNKSFIKLIYMNVIQLINSISNLSHIILIFRRIVAQKDRLNPCEYTFNLNACLVMLPINLYNKGTMSESQPSTPNCSNCNKPKTKYDTFTPKCEKHNYKLCAVCTRTLRNKECPECSAEKTQEIKNQQSSPYTRKQEAYNGSVADNRTEVSLEDILIKNSELKRIREQLSQVKIEKEGLVKKVNELQLENAQKQLEIKNKQIDKFKMKDLCDEELKNAIKTHAQELQNLKLSHQIQMGKLAERLEKQSKLKQDMAIKQSEELKKKMLTQKEETDRVKQLQLTLLKTNFQNQRQKLLLQMQNQKNKDLVRTDTRQKEIRQEYESEIRTIRNKYDAQITDLRNKTERDKEMLVTNYTSEKQLLLSRHEQEKNQIKQKIESEKNILAETHQKEKGELRGSYIHEKVSLQSLLQTKNRQFQVTIARLGEQNARLKETQAQIQAEKSKKQIDYEKLISEQNLRITQVTTDKDQLANYIKSHEKSLDHYQKQITDFDRYIQKNNNNIIEQFKSLDDTYHEPTPQKMKIMQLLIKQYKGAVQSTKHPELLRIIRQRQSIVSNYVAKEMIQSQKSLQEIDIRDLYYFHSQKGIKFKRAVQKVSLFRSLQNQNVNDNIEMYFQPKLMQKLKSLLLAVDQKITNCNNEMSEFQLIKQINEYYEVKQFLSLQFADHIPYCEAQYKAIDENISVAFQRFKQTYNQIKQNKPAQKLEDYLNRAEQLKRFIQIVNHGKSYKKYSYYLEQHLNLKVDEIKNVMLTILNQNKKSLKAKLDNLMVTRVYFDCYLYQKIFKKLKIFDQILTKEENSYYNFNFTQLYNKIINFLRVLKDQKINLCDVLITEQKINMQGLDKQFAGIAFDESIKIRYLYKLKNVLQNRTATLNRMNNNTFITDKLLEQFQTYFQEAHQLKNIKQINQIPQISEQLTFFGAKMIIIIDFLELKFKQCYASTTEFKQLDETNRNIKHYYQFEMFVQKNFEAEHQQLKNRVVPIKFSYLPQPQGQDECIFSNLLKLNITNKNILDQVISTAEQPLKEQHFDYYTNMINYLPKVEGNKVQMKLHKAVMESVTQLESKEWLDGQVNSPIQRRLMSCLNKLQNKQIAYYRQLITIHKNKIMDQRQRIINSEKRKLKEDDFQNLEQFLAECRRNEQNNSKFYKLYVNILEDYMNYSYDNIVNDVNKKANFLNNLYKLNISTKAKSLREIFKSKQHKIYFCRPQLMSIRNNITLIQKFEGQNDIDITKVTQSLVNAVRLYSIFKENEGKSLLDDKERQKIHQEIESINGTIITNYLNVCRHLDHQKIFDEKCNRNKLFLDLIKIQIYGKIMKKCQEYTPNHEYYENKSKYDQIVNKINTKIEKVHEQAKQFRFYKDELKLQYDNNHFLFQHLKKIERLVDVFKEIKYKLFKFEDYLKNNYLEEIHLKNINYKQLISIVEMSWIKEYAIIKKEISQLFRTHELDIVLKYKMILHEKEIVKNQNLLCFNQIIKEEYDFKRIVIEQLMMLQSKVERYLQNLEKEHESFVMSEKKLDEKKKHHVETQKVKIKQKYQKLIAQVQNSFHQISDEALRQKKIQAEINTLNNQLRTQEQYLLNQEATKLENFRNKFNQKTDNIITKFFEAFMTIKKIQANFDTEIQQLCKKITGKAQFEMDKFDKGLKNIFINYAKKAKNSDMILGLGSLNLFKQINEEQFQLNTKAMNDINQIIKKCPQTKNNPAFSKRLSDSFDQYQQQLQRVEKEFYQTRSQNRVLQLVKQTKAQAQQLSPSVVIARIFAVYSIYRCIDSHQEEITFDGNPHIAQIVAILLLIDAQNGKSAKFGNRLIQVKTGQGKSRVLAGLNCYLAIYGYDVYCGCYSSYLSQRDQQQFHSLFVRFGVSKMITYGPFSQHCESVFNEGSKYNFKQITKKVLLNEQLSSSNMDYLQRLNRMLKHENRVNRILVIDQVDVFFDENYFGKIYAPGVAIDAPEVKRLIRFIWDNHKDRRLNRLTFQSEQYRNLVNLYPHLTQLLKNQVQSMIHACNNYNIHPYEIRNNQIQYVDNDTVNSKLNFGYSTAFASCYEYERGKISETNYNKNINISLIIGQFSYAELPKYFDHIMGVSGTVEAMSDFRKKIMKEDYKITDIYTLPSIYGDSHRQIVGFHTCDKSQYLGYLLDRIHSIRRNQRPILVFFQTQQQLNIVSGSPQFNQFTTNIYKITQKMPPEMRNPLINYAGTRNRITLISSAFSRGTDFTVYDSDINQKGGMHVIQTYISKNESDFIQILGRTGRQGKNGSFEMIVTIDDLKKSQIPIVGDKELFNVIRESWKVHDIKHGNALSKSIQQARSLHEGTFDVVGSMAKVNSKLVDAVMKLNYNEIKGETIKTIIAIDGTGSMGAALNAVLSILKETISRTDQIINMRMPNVSFEHKIMIYRNYNTNLEKILQQSNFSKDPGYLQAFMTSIKPEGGLGNEAHQVLFFDIGKQLQFQKIDQIIIIGDAPANKLEEMIKHRIKFRGNDYWLAKFPVLQSIEDYSAVVKARAIPIHSFYILRRKQEEESIKWDANVKTYFEALSIQSKGSFDQLNIRDKERAKDQLTDFISERVLELIGGRDLLDLYSQMFSKRYV